MELTDMAALAPTIRLVLFAFALTACAFTLTGAAFAQQSCGEDLKRLSEKREAELTRVNNLVRAAKGKPIDPSMFCSQSSGLNNAENALIAYMEKNKDWCGVPDEAIDGLKANHVKSLAFSAKACKVAAQMKKQQAESAAPAQPLPAGPL
jgi:hypothetical protein